MPPVHCVRCSPRHPSCLQSSRCVKQGGQLVGIASPHERASNSTAAREAAAGASCGSHRLISLHPAPHPPAPLPPTTPPRSAAYHPIQAPPTGVPTPPPGPPRLPSPPRAPAAAPARSTSAFENVGLGYGKRTEKTPSPPLTTSSRWLSAGISIEIQLVSGSDEFELFWTSLLPGIAAAGVHCTVGRGKR